jgi:hypothetical protein
MSDRNPTALLRATILGCMDAWLAGEPVWPLADIWRAWGSEFRMYRYAWAAGEHASRRPSVDLYGLRDEWIRRYGFAIPCRELIDTLAANAPIVEIGAGSGYMTAIMRANGIDVVGSDPANEEFPFAVGKFDTEQSRLKGAAAVRRYPDRTVFCCWPTLHGRWFLAALKAMRVGQRIIVVREDACADESTWRYLDACFDHDRDIEIPAWNFMNDYLRRGG